MANSVYAATLTLASGGRTSYKIVLPDRASAAQELAAGELATYLERISGAKFPIQHGGSLPSRAIVFSGIWIPDVADELSGESYAIAIRGENIFLVGGRDRASLFAAYQLLHALGCRWLAPAFDFYKGSSELVPVRPDLTLELGRDIFESPALGFRKLYVEEGHSHTASSLVRIVEWMAKLGYNTLVTPSNYQGRGRVRWDNWRLKVAPELLKRDLILEVGGHGYQNFLNAEMEDGKFFQDHSEWFGQDDTGRRRREQAFVFCTSNPEAVKFVIASLVRYVRQRPEIQIFDFWPPDGARWCECHNCKALGSPSERQTLLVNQVQAEASKVLPGLRIECLAYQKTITPPQGTTLDKKVLLDFCPIRQNFEVQIYDPTHAGNGEYVSGLKAWRNAFAGDISLYSYYRKYAWKSLPVVIPHYIWNDLHWYLRVPIQGISTYAEPGDWYSYELNHYVLGRLAWAPSANVDRLIAEFTEARYKGAAGAARAALEALEKVVRNFSSIPYTQLKAPEQIAGASAELESAAGKLQAARQSSGDAIVDAHLERLLLAFEYARRDLDIQGARAAKAPEIDLRGKIQELAAFLAEHQNRGVFLIHDRLELPRLLPSYGLNNIQE